MNSRSKNTPARASLSALIAEISKLTLGQKLRLEKKLAAAIATDIDALGCPPSVMHGGDPNLEAELDRRWRDAKDHPERLLTLDQLMRNVSRKIRARKKLGEPLSRRGNRKS